MSSKFRLTIIFLFILIFFNIVLLSILIINIWAGQQLSILPIQGLSGQWGSLLILVVMLLLCVLDLKKVAAIKVKNQSINWKTIFKSRQIDFNEIKSLKEEFVVSKLSNKNRLTVIKTKHHKFIIAEFYILNYDDIVGQIKVKMTSEN